MTSKGNITFLHLLCLLHCPPLGTCDSCLTVKSVYLSPCAHGQDESFNKLEIISKYDSANKKMKSFDATNSIQSIWVCSTHQPISAPAVVLNAPVPVWTLIFTRENLDTWVLPILKAWVQLLALLRSEWTWSNASDVSHTWLSRISSLRVV